MCVYPAYNSVESSSGLLRIIHVLSYSLHGYNNNYLQCVMMWSVSGAGRTRSVFDIFREDVVTSVDSTPVENTFVEVL